MISSSWRIYAALACLLPVMAHGASARVPAGSHFRLALAHHITSGQTPAGAPVWFRVIEDFRVRDAVVVRKGTLVRGQMTAAAQRGAIGASGSMNFGLRFVPAVDGQNIRVISSLASNGRDRGNALVGWTLMWGWFGLMTKGADAFALRGAELDAEVLSDKVVEVPAETSAAEAVPTDAGMALAGHRVGTARSKPVALDFERFKRSTISFELPSQGDRKGSGAGVQAARIIAINGVAPPEAVESTSLVFDLWQVLQHCDDGDNNLQFQVTTAEGTVPAHYSLPVKFILRKK